MAIGTAAGYTNLPSGNFLPEIYSQKVLKFFRKASVVEDITNTDYFGEIENFGDTVRIIKEPTITVSAYTRGSSVNTQDLADDEIQLTVDKANAFAFKVDDIEERQGHINFETLATSAGAYTLKDTYDSEVLSNIQSNVTSTNTYGADHATNSIDTGFDTSEVDPVNVLARLGRLLDDQNVPTDNRWAVAAPRFFEELQQTSSKLLDANFLQEGSKSQVRNGLVVPQLVNGFRLYKSNNMPSASTSDVHIVLAGHQGGVATASQIAKTEVVRDTESFADIVRGLHVYGRKVLRTESIAQAYVKLD